VTVADARFAKPIDLDLTARLAAEHDLLSPWRRATCRRLRLGRVGGAERRRAARPAHPAHRPSRPLRHPGKPALLHREVGFTGSAIAKKVAAAVGADLGAVLTGA
jgi:1-deoxy-D-xylulose-5-phosphate synthase